MNRQIDKSKHDSLLDRYIDARYMNRYNDRKYKIKTIQIYLQIDR